MRATILKSNKELTKSLVFFSSFRTTKNSQFLKCLAIFVAPGISKVKVCQRFSRFQIMLWVTIFNVMLNAQIVRVLFVLQSCNYSTGVIYSFFQSSGCHKSQKSNRKFCWSMNLIFSEVFQTFQKINSKTRTTKHRSSSFGDFFQKIGNAYKSKQNFVNFGRNSVIVRKKNKLLKISTFFYDFMSGNNKYLSTRSWIHKYSASNLSHSYEKIEWESSVILPILVEEEKFGILVEKEPDFL